MRRCASPDLTNPQALIDAFFNDLRRGLCSAHHCFNLLWIRAGEDQSEDVSYDAVGVGMSVGRSWYIKPE